MQIALTLSFFFDRKAPAPLPRRLAHRGIASLPEALGRRIDCESGCLWITHDGDPREVVLATGESYVSPIPGRVLVYALEASRVRWG